MQEMGHSPRAMEHLFDLPYQERVVLTDAVYLRTALRNAAKLPSSRLQTAAKATANGSTAFSRSNAVLAVQPFCCVRQIRFMGHLLFLIAIAVSAYLVVEYILRLLCKQTTYI